ncbi:ABC transporter permease [Paenibacillus whitsoniae]|uniref:ABC transporter permease n=1 Tax=Paenibacillus whitsoniae TaxID=2496558 RepID=UPI001F498912|nr:ABC transporter permease [Paenibacillus whitsoniae]
MDLVFNLVERDLKLKYKGSIIGFMWSLVNPLIMLIIYTWVFKTIMKTNTPNFSIFLMAGLLPWNFFASTLTMSVGAFTNNASLLTKVKLPKYILVLSNVVFNFVIFLMMIVLILGAMKVFNVPYTLSLLYLPVALIAQLIFMISLSLILAISNVFFSDTSHLLEVFIMAWFWLTPVIYQFDLIPEQFQYYVSLNPMSLVINLYQAAILGTPIYTNVLSGIIIILVFLFLSIFLYRKYNKKISELV